MYFKAHTCWFQMNWVVKGLIFKREFHWIWQQWSTLSFELARLRWHSVQIWRGRLLGSPGQSWDFQPKFCDISLYWGESHRILRTEDRGTLLFESRHIGARLLSQRQNSSIRSIYSMRRDIIMKRIARNIDMLPLQACDSGSRGHLGLNLMFH